MVLGIAFTLLLGGCMGALVWAVVQMWQGRGRR